MSVPQNSWLVNELRRNKRAVMKISSQRIERLVDQNLEVVCEK